MVGFDYVERYNNINEVLCNYSFFKNNPKFDTFRAFLKEFLTDLDK